MSMVYIDNECAPVKYTNVEQLAVVQRLYTGTTYVEMTRIREGVDKRGAKCPKWTSR